MSSDILAKISREHVKECPYTIDEITDMLEFTKAHMNGYNYLPFSDNLDAGVYTTEDLFTLAKEKGQKCFERIKDLYTDIEANRTPLKYLWCQTPPTDGFTVAYPIPVVSTIPQTFYQIELPNNFTKFALYSRPPDSTQFLYVPYICVLGIGVLAKPKVKMVTFRCPSKIYDQHCKLSTSLKPEKAKILNFKFTAPNRINL
ncbi:hypothetical protein KDA11_01835, partial [Candidatus Saccharibacteria bacterium]|nr:hypothetical protein [Candidatus Saccharibacteria bacterium]